jgi:hypothetical protein
VVEQLRQIMARYCPEHVDYDRDVMAREEALERQRQERNRQYRLEQNSADGEGENENENESEERSEEEGGEASAKTMASPVSPKPLRKRGPSINVVQQALACRDTAQATRKVMLDQLRQLSRQRDLPHTFSLALPEPEQLTAAPSPAADAPTPAATPRLADVEAAAMKESDASTMMPLTPAVNDAAPPPSATDDGGATATATAAAGTAPEDEAKLKEKEERKRRVEEIRAKMQRQTSSRISVPKGGGSNAPLSPGPTNQDQG